MLATLTRWLTSFALGLLKEEPQILNSDLRAFENNRIILSDMEKKFRGKQTTQKCSSLTFLHW